MDLKISGSVSGESGRLLLCAILFCIMLCHVVGVCAVDAVVVGKEGGRLKRDGL